MGSIFRPTAVEALRSLLAQKNTIISCPGVYDGLTARIALKAGFDCLYMSGAGTTMSKLGMADLGIATLNDMRDNAAMIASLDRSVPVIADADTGFGGSLMVGRTVAQYMSAGVAALHLEDQVQNKRCGHLRNKELVSEEIFASRIRAAVNSRAQNHGDIVLIARTDALQSLGFDAAVSRLKTAISIGADVAFLEGITSLSQVKCYVEELYPTPVLYNMVQGGVSPHLTVAEAKELGVRIIIYPSLCTRAVYESVTASVMQLKEHGDFPSNANGTKPHDIFALCGLNEAIEFDKDAGSDVYAAGV